MTNYDEEAFVREMQHKEMMRKQRIDLVIANYEIPKNTYTDTNKDNNNEIND